MHRVALISKQMVFQQMNSTQRASISSFSESFCLCALFWSNIFEYVSYSKHLYDTYYTNIEQEVLNANGK